MPFSEEGGGVAMSGEGGEIRMREIIAEEIAKAIPTIVEQVVAALKHKGAAGDE